MPADTPVITPVTESMVATDGLTLCHTPPAGIALQVAVVPTHTLLTPILESVTDETTATVRVATQPAGVV